MRRGGKEEKGKGQSHRKRDSEREGERVKWGEKEAVKKRQRGRDTQKERKREIVAHWGVRCCIGVY